MQEPTQNIQNEQMISPMDMGARTQRAKKRVQLNETSSSEVFKRPVVKAKPARSSMIAPMMERLGSTVLLDPASSSKDEATTSSLCAIDGIDVAFEVMKTRAREIQFQDGEQESVAIVDREDPSVSKTINAHEARTGKKLDSEEVREKRCESLMSSKSK